MHVKRAYVSNDVEGVTIKMKLIWWTFFIVQFISYDLTKKSTQNKQPRLYGSLLEFVFYKRMYDNKQRRAKFRFLERLKIKITRLLSESCVLHSSLES